MAIRHCPSGNKLVTSHGPRWPVGDVANAGLDPVLVVLRQLLEAVGVAGDGDDVRAGGLQHAGEPCPSPAESAVRVSRATGPSRCPLYRL